MPTASPKSRRVVVTGMGVIAPSGIGAEALWDMLMSGRSAVRLIAGFDTSDLPVRIGAQVRDFDVCDYVPTSWADKQSRFCQFATASARLAVSDAAIPDAALCSARAGLFLGTAAGPAGAWEEKFMNRQGRDASSTAVYTISPHSATVLCANSFGITGPISTLMSDCPAALDAVAAGYQQIRADQLDVALVGGADAPVTRLLFTGFARSGMLAASDTPETACRPFARDRNGFVLAEGGATLVLEEAEHAARRGARIYGEVCGAGAGHDLPTYLGGSSRAERGFRAAATRALDQAAISLDEIDHVNAHAPGMPGTDLAEARGLSNLFSGRRDTVPVTSIKGAVGHPLAAAAMLQVAISLLALERGVVPPTTNCTELDPECTIDVVRGEPRRTRAPYALIIGHGFGGNTTAVVVRTVGSFSDDRRTS